MSTNIKTEGTVSLSINELREGYKNDIEKIKQDNKIALDEKDSEIKKLKGINEDQTKDQLIKELRAEIEKLTLKKGFWGFLH